MTTPAPADRTEAAEKGPVLPSLQTPTIDRGRPHLRTPQLELRRLAVRGHEPDASEGALRRHSWKLAARLTRMARLTLSRAWPYGCRLIGRRDLGESEVTHTFPAFVVCFELRLLNPGQIQVETPQVPQQVDALEIEHHSRYRSAAAIPSHHRRHPCCAGHDECPSARRQKYWRNVHVPPAAGAGRHNPSLRSAGVRPHPRPALPCPSPPPSPSPKRASWPRRRPCLRLRLHPYFRPRLRFTATSTFAPRPRPRPRPHQVCIQPVVAAPAVHGQSAQQQPRQHQDDCCDGCC